MTRTHSWKSYVETHSRKSPISIQEIQPIPGGMAQNLEIIPKTLSTYQNLAYGIYDLPSNSMVLIINSMRILRTPGTKSKVFRNDREILCHPICNYLYECAMWACGFLKTHSLKSFVLKTHPWKSRVSIDEIPTCHVSVYVCVCSNGTHELCAQLLCAGVRHHKWSHT